MKKQAFNPYLPSWEYVPDGEPRVFEGRVYVYGSHDAFGGSEFCQNDYVCWSAPEDDLGNWECHGIIYRADQDPQNPRNTMKLFAPDVVQGTDGRYYLYYSLNASSLVSVAVCDRPEGPYQFLDFVRWPDGHPLGSERGAISCFDPGVLAQGEEVYLYTGFAPGSGALFDQLTASGRRIEGAYCTALEQDMRTVKREPVKIVPGVHGGEETGFRGHEFFEASSIRKIGDRYCFVYSSILSHELCYATSRFPDRDFVFGGTLVSIGDIGLNGSQTPMNYTGNTHGGMANIRGQWYIFYHRQTNRQCCARQGCAEPITIRPDGSIPQVPLSSCGLNGGPLRGTGRYEARIACHLGCREPGFAYLAVRETEENHPYFTQSGEDREEAPDQYIANMRDGAWCGFKTFDFSGETRIALTCRGGSGIMHVSHGRQDPPFVAIPIPAGTEWHTSSANFSPIFGEKDLYFTFSGDEPVDFMEFSME